MINPIEETDDKPSGVEKFLLFFLGAWLQKYLRSLGFASTLFKLDKYAFDNASLLDLIEVMYPLKHPSFSSNRLIHVSTSRARKTSPFTNPDLPPLPPFTAFCHPKKKLVIAQKIKEKKKKKKLSTFRYLDVYAWENAHSCMRWSRQRTSNPWKHHSSTKLVDC